METLQTIQTLLLVLQVLVAVTLIGFILIQHGKGADAGAAFGSGASSTVFGAQGSGNFLSRTTTVLAFVFLANSLGLGYIAKERIAMSKGLMDHPAVTQPAEGKQPAPATTENGGTAPASSTTTENNTPAETNGTTAPQQAATEQTAPAPDQGSDVPKIPE